MMIVFDAGLHPCGPSCRSTAEFVASHATTAYDISLLNVWKVVSVPGKYVMLVCDVTAYRESVPWQR